MITTYREKNLTKEPTVAFIGSKVLGLKVLKEMLDYETEVKGICTVDDRHDLRSAYSQIKGIAKQMQNYYTNLEYMLDVLRPDFCIMCGWYDKIPVASYPSTTFVGFHNSALPEHRGGAPLVNTILANEASATCSIFKLDEGIDTGPIYCQPTIPIFPTDDIGELETRLNAWTVINFKILYPKLITGMAEPRPQNKPHFLPKPHGQRTREDAFIEWDTIKEVYNFIRAQQSPYPKAFTIIDGQKYGITMMLHRRRQ